MLALVALCLLSGSLQPSEGTCVPLLAARVGAPKLTCRDKQCEPCRAGAQNIPLPAPVGQGRRVEHLRIRTYAHTGWDDSPVGAAMLHTQPLADLGQSMLYGPFCLPGCICSLHAAAP